MKVAKLGLAAALVLGAVLLISSTASAEGVFYYKGPHAVPSEFGGFCNISVRHFHTYKPNDMKVFRSDENTYIFIGDPTAHGFVGPKVAFYGHHPIPAGWGGGWCFIGGPHYHFYRTGGAHWSWHGGTYYYTGPFTDPWYIRNRAIYEPIFSTYYTTRPGYVRPIVYAPPPRIYVGPRVTVPVTRWTGPTVRVNVGMPAVRVGVPGVRIGGPAVRVGGPAIRVGGPPAVHPPAPGVGVRPGVGPGPGVRPGIPGPGGRPGVAPGPGARPMPPGKGMPPAAKGPAPRPMPAAKGPAPRPMPAAKGPAPRPAPAAKGPAPRPMPAAKAPAPRPAPAAKAPAPRPAPAPARPAPRPAGKRP